VISGVDTARVHQADEVDLAAGAHRSVDDTSNVATLPGGPRGSGWMNGCALLGRDTPDALDQPESGSSTAQRCAQLSGGRRVRPERAWSWPRAWGARPLAGRGEGATGRHNITLRGLSLQRCRYDLPPEGRIDPRPPARPRKTYGPNCHRDAPWRSACWKTWAATGGAGPRLPGTGGVSGTSSAHSAPAGCGSANRGELSPRLLPPAIPTSSPTTSCTPWAGSCRRPAHHHSRAARTDRHNHNHRPVLHGISVGGTGAIGHAVPVNVIEFNDVHDSARCGSVTWAASYTLGPQRRTVSEQPLPRHRELRLWRLGACTTDEGAAESCWEQCRASLQERGLSPALRFATTGAGTTCWPSTSSIRHAHPGRAHRSFWFTPHVVSRTPHSLGSDWSGTTNNFLNDDNLWFDTRNGPTRRNTRSPASLSAWQARGQDRPRAADPGLD